MGTCGGKQATGGSRSTEAAAPKPPPPPPEPTLAKPALVHKDSTAGLSTPRALGSTAAGRTLHTSFIPELARTVMSGDQPLVRGQTPRLSAAANPSCTSGILDSTASVQLPALPLEDAGLVTLPPPRDGRLLLDTAEPAAEVCVDVEGREVLFTAVKGSSSGVRYTVAGKALPPFLQAEWDGSSLHFPDIGKTMPMAGCLSRRELASALASLRVLFDSRGVVHNLRDRVHRRRRSLTVGTRVVCRTTEGWVQGEVVALSAYRFGVLHDVLVTDDSSGNGEEDVYLQGWHRDNLRDDDDSSPRDTDSLVSVTDSPATELLHASAMRTRAMTTGQVPDLRPQLPPLRRSQSDTRDSRDSRSSLSVHTCSTDAGET
eukprot:TRINITY_DN13043_c0_g1_i1.p1 TRINITY_DN13043_c0_g1~~TRINITY_DN13043_c0_g1_i1.p1  ORF type:complete len:373 (+),score=72.35 TRINITY_DN13043_c0_g1_i1:58-1176(+)